VNVAGSFVLALLVELMALRWSPGPEVRALLVVGVLGAFTTFSTFSLDVVTLAQRQAWTPAALYVAGSVVLSVGAFVLGLRLGRLVFAG
jgi:CrcB protein